MAVNKVQLQRGLSLPDFIKKYGTEEQCHNQLLMARWSDGFECPDCRSKHSSWINRDKAYRCLSCNKQTSLRSGTLFQGSNLPLSKWFLGIYLMTQCKNGISQLELSRQVGVSSNTGALMYHKIAQVMLKRNDDKPISGDIDLDDAYWGGKNPGGKRGRGSENKTPFIAALAKVKGKPDQMKLTVVEGWTHSVITDWAKKHLRPGSNVMSDGLKCFSGVLEAECTHSPLVKRRSHNSETVRAFNWIDTILGNLKTALAGTFHKLHPEHLKRHLATFSYRFNRRYSLKSMIHRFTYVAVRTKPTTRRDLTLCGNSG